MAKKTRRAASTQTSFDGSDVKEARQALFQALEQHAKKENNSENSSSDDDETAPPPLHPLVRLFSQPCGAAQNPKEQKLLLCQVMKEFSAADLRRFSGSLAPALDDIVASQSYLPQEQDDEEEGNSKGINASNEGDDDDDDENIATSGAVATDVRSTRSLQLLRVTAVLLHAYWEVRAQSPRASVPDEFWHIVTPLHDILLDLQQCGPMGRTTQTLILDLCESLFHANLPDRAAVVAQTFTLLVVQALEQGTTTRRWNRLYEMREALGFLDWEDPASGWLRSMLLRLASQPHCLKQSAGKRFLASILQLEPDEELQEPDVASQGSHEHEEEGPTHNLHGLAADLHQAIKVQVPSAKLSMLQAYGEIYWRAWKDTEDLTVQARLEATVWQDWVYAVLHVQQAATYKAVQTLLQPLHQQAKATPAGSELLHRLYGPILWRSLRATHAIVRVHAAHCLAAVFPLTTPTRILPAMNQACEALLALLQDKDDRVRVAGVTAVGQVLGIYWDAVPATTLRTLLNTLVTQLASDAPSSSVRASVLGAITNLLEYPATHAVLRPLLPSLGNLLHDRVETVRVAAVRLLIQIKAVPGFKYYHVVPLHHLLSRLASETKPTGPVAQGLTALMLNSYLPADNRQAVRRAARFLQESPAAAQVFYSNVHAHIPVTEVVKLVLLLWKALAAAVLGEESTEKEQRLPADTTNRKRQRRTKGRNNETVDDDSKNDTDQSQYAGLLPTDVNLWPRIAETVSALWGSVEDQLDQSDYNECSQALLEVFSGKMLLSVLRRLEHGEAQEDRRRSTAAILRCAARLPTEAVDDLVQYVAGVLEAPTGNLSPHVALLCLWGQTEKVAPVLASSLSGPSRGLFRRSSLPDPVIPTLEPAVAIDIVKDLLSGSDPSSVAARESILQSPSARTMIASALEKGLHRAEAMLKDGNVLSDMSMSEVEHVIKLCELFGRFCLHAQANPDETEMNGHAETLLHWTTHIVLPALATPTAVFEDVDLSRISMDQSFRAPLSPLGSPGPRRRSNRNKTPTRLDGALDATSSQPVAFSNPIVTNRLQQDLAVSLLQATCLLFCEWLAVGRPSALMISQSAQAWAAALAKEQVKLLPALGRLAVQIINASHDAGVLREIMVNCSESHDTGALQQVLAVLLGARGTAAGDIHEATLQGIVNALEQLTSKTEVNPIDDFPTSLPEAWPYQCGAMATVFQVATNNPKTLVKLAKALLDGLVERSEKFRLAALHFLFVLLAGDVPDEMADVVRSLDATTLDPESRAVPLIQELRQAVPS
eukprot:scaffold9427_cov175-Amphora_coffeaeformis.AAC.4